MTGSLLWSPFNTALQAGNQVQKMQHQNKAAIWPFNASKHMWGDNNKTLISIKIAWQRQPLIYPCKIDDKPNLHWPVGSCIYFNAAFNAGINLGSKFC